MPASAASFKRGLRPDTGVSVNLSPNTSPPKISIDWVRGCSSAMAGVHCSANAAIAGRTEPATAYFVKFDSDMTPPRLLVNTSLRLEERELQRNPISLDGS